MRFFPFFIGFCFFIGTAFLFISCERKDSGERSSQQLLEDAITAHGGLDQWKKVQSIGYEKTTHLYLPDGELEKSVIQQHFYRLSPKLSGTIRWTVDSVAYEISYADGKAKKVVNGEVATADDVLQQAKDDFLAAYFTLCQPFKLQDEGTKLTYLGSDRLEDEQEVAVLKVEYPGAQKADTWWYYFHPQTSHVLANMVDHGKGFSYIKNLAYDQSTGIVFNRHRKSYTVDSVRNIQYLRAEYFNRGFQVTYN